jgi:hypothetical protein
MPCVDAGRILLVMKPAVSLWPFLVLGSLKIMVLRTALVVQHAFENLDEEDTRDLVDEVLQSFDRIIRDAWGSKSQRCDLLLAP